VVIVQRAHALKNLREHAFAVKTRNGEALKRRIGLVQKGKQRKARSKIEELKAWVSSIR
jgi:hypothetical protein